MARTATVLPASGESASCAGSKERISRKKRRMENPDGGASKKKVKLDVEQSPGGAECKKGSNAAACDALSPDLPQTLREGDIDTNSSSAVESSDTDVAMNEDISDKDESLIPETVHNDFVGLCSGPHYCHPPRNCFGSRCKTYRIFPKPIVERRQEMQEEFVLAEFEIDVVIDGVQVTTPLKDIPKEKKDDEKKEEDEKKDEEEEEKCRVIDNAEDDDYILTVGGDVVVNIDVHQPRHEIFFNHSDARHMIAQAIYYRTLPELPPESSPEESEQNSSMPVDDDGGDDETIRISDGVTRGHAGIEPVSNNDNGDDENNSNGASVDLNSSDRLANNDNDDGDSEADKRVNCSCSGICCCPSLYHQPGSMPLEPGTPLRSPLNGASPRSSPETSRKRHGNEDTSSPKKRKRDRKSRRKRGTREAKRDDSSYPSASTKRPQNSSSASTSKSTTETVSHQKHTGSSRSKPKDNSIKTDPHSERSHKTSKKSNRNDNDQPSPSKSSKRHRKNREACSKFTNNNATSSNSPVLVQSSSVSPTSQTQRNPDRQPCQTHSGKKRNSSSPHRHGSPEKKTQHDSSARTRVTNIRGASSLSLANATDPTNRLDQSPQSYTPATTPPPATGAMAMPAPLSPLPGLSSPRSPCLPVTPGKNYGHQQDYLRRRESSSSDANYSGVANVDEVGNAMEGPSGSRHNLEGPVPRNRHAERERFLASMNVDQLVKYFDLEDSDSDSMDGDGMGFHWGPEPDDSGLESDDELFGGGENNGESMDQEYDNFAAMIPRPVPDVQLEHGEEAGEIAAGGIDNNNNSIGDGFPEYGEILGAGVDGDIAEEDSVRAGIAARALPTVTDTAAAPVHVAYGYDDRRDRERRMVHSLYPTATPWNNRRITRRGRRSPEPDN